MLGICPIINAAKTITLLHLLFKGPPQNVVLSIKLRLLAIVSILLTFHFDVDTFIRLM